MAFNRSCWKKLGFGLTKNPPWPCPACGGALSKSKDTFIINYAEDLPQNIVNLTKEEIPNLDFIQYRFIGRLECNTCNLKFSTSGYAHNTDRFDNAVGHDFYDKKGKVLYPISFDPPLRIISIPKKCPQEIIRQLNNAFYHYWNDRASSANRIRSIAELIMDEQEVHNSTVLHQRIAEFKRTKNKDLGESLESIKWIGNAGSHIQSINKIDLLDAFELLEHVLDQLYPDESSITRIRDLTEKVNKNKGPLSGKRN